MVRKMAKEAAEDYELIAKHCPMCESLVLAKVEKEITGKSKYTGYKCSNCSWASPTNRGK